MRKKGFTLIECMAYLCVSTFFTLLVLQSYMALQRTITQKIAATDEYIAVASCIDTMMSDIACAPIDTKLWASTGPLFISWLDDNNNQIGFAFNKDKLLRITRSRDENGYLKGAAYSVLARNIKGTFHVSINNAHIGSVQLQAATVREGDNKSYTMTMRPREGVVNA